MNNRFGDDARNFRPVRNVQDVLERSRQPMEVEDALKDGQIVTLFQDFLQQQHCGENLTFWLFVERYRDASCEDREFLGTDAYKQHFEEDCAVPVNVDGKLRAELRHAFLHGYWPANLFDRAQYQVLHMLKYDWWPRYQEWAAANKTSSAGGQGRRSRAFPKTNGLLSPSLAPPKDSCWASTLHSLDALQAAPTTPHSSRRQSLIAELNPFHNMRFGRRRRESVAPNEDTVSLFSLDGDAKQHGYKSASQKGQAKRRASFGAFVHVSLPTGHSTLLSLPDDRGVSIRRWLRLCGVKGAAEMAVLMDGEGEVDHSASALQTLFGRRVCFVARPQQPEQQSKKSTVLEAVRRVSGRFLPEGSSAKSSTTSYKVSEPRRKSVGPLPTASKPPRA